MLGHIFAKHLPSPDSSVFDVCVPSAVGMVTGTDVSGCGMWAESGGMGPLGREGFVVPPGASSDGATVLPLLLCVSVPRNELSGAKLSSKMVAVDCIELQFSLEFTGQRVQKKSYDHAPHLDYTSHLDHTLILTTPSS